MPLQIHRRSCGWCRTAVPCHRASGTRSCRLKAVLLVSLELDEVMDVSDRILVMYEGELVGQLDPKTVSVEELGLYMAGAKRDPVPEEV